MDDKPNTDLKSEFLKMCGWLIRDFVLQMRFALICAIVGAAIGAATCAYFGLPLAVGALAGAAILGGIGMVSFIGQFRR